MSLVKTNWLDGVTSATTSPPEEVTGTSSYAVQASATGAPDTATVVLEGSLDDVDYVTLATVSGLSGDAQVAWAQDKPVKWIRLRVTELTGGTSPSITASALAT